LVNCYSSLDTWLNVPRILLLNILRNVPDDTTLLAELHAPGYPASSVKTFMCNNVLHDKLALSFFAIQRAPDTGISSNSSLEDVEHLLGLWGLPMSDYSCLEPGWSAEQLLASAAPSTEGFVLKDGNLLNWRKLKRKCSVDLLIWGYIKGRDKYRGQVGALIVGTFERYILAQCSGFTDAQRLYITEHQSELLNTVVEVEYQYLGSGGRLRHPQFKRFRDDKWAAECHVAQNAELAAYYGVEYTQPG
jgi:hypothetical protein